MLGGHANVLQKLGRNPGVNPGTLLGNAESQLGSTAVALFFMVSAYLFCGLLITRRGQIDVTAFAIGRVRRIVPLYACAVLLALTILLAQTGLHLRVPPWTLATDLIRLGSFDFWRAVSVNGNDGIWIIGQAWTLRYEWMLYALIPLMAIAVRRAGASWPLFAILAGCCLLDGHFAFFVAGSAAVLLVRMDGPWIRYGWQIAGAIGLALVIRLYHECNDWRQAILLLPAFVAALQGHRWFALLGAAAPRYLGEISYSVYLLHNMVVFFVIDVVVGRPAYARFGAIETGATIIAIGILAVAVATLSFLFIERPMMRQRAALPDPRRAAHAANAA